MLWPSRAPAATIKPASKGHWKAAYQGGLIEIGIAIAIAVLVVRFLWIGTGE